MTDSQENSGAGNRLLELFGDHLVNPALADLAQPQPFSETYLNLFHKAQIGYSGVSIQVFHKFLTQYRKFGFQVQQHIEPLPGCKARVS